MAVGIANSRYGVSNQPENPAAVSAGAPASGNDGEPWNALERPRLRSHPSIKDQGEVSLTELYNEGQEAAWAVGEISTLARSKEGFRRGDCAIMYRTNAQSRAFEDVCRERGIPYRLVGGVRFYDRKEIKDTLCYLRVIYNPGDEVSLLRVINTPPRGIGAKTVLALSDFAAARGVALHAAMQEVAAARAESRPSPVSVTARAAKSIADLSVMLDRLNAAARELGVADLLDRTLDMSGLAAQIQKEDDGDERWDNIQELRGMASNYGPAGNGSIDGLSAFLERVSLVSDVDAYEQSDDALTLITLHQTKGLEFPVVMITGMEHGLLPHSRSLDTQDEIDEERRLCYVGMTRAQKRLYMSYALYRRNAPTLPSPFLYDLPEEVRAGTPLAGTARRYQFNESGEMLTPSGGNAGLREGGRSRPSPAEGGTAPTAERRSGSPGGSYGASRPTRNADAVIGGDYGRARRESRTRLGQAGEDGAAGRQTRGRLRGNIDEKLTEWNAAASTASASAGGRATRPSTPPPPARPPLTVGEIVRHPAFGEGVVQEVQGSGDTEQATVNFGNGIGLKRLLVSLAQLQRG